MAVFVGRGRELERLKRLLEGAQRGKGRAVFITGEAGAGKSSLVSQFMVDAALGSPDTRIIGASCSEQYGAGEPYQPFVEAFRDLMTEQERPGSRWSGLREVAAELAPAWIAAIPLAGGLISATMATAVELRKLGGGVAAAAPSEEALFFQYSELFFAAAAQAPIILFIDDLHWADRASVALLAHLARRIGDQRVLILGTYRAADVDIGQHPIREAKLELERYGVAEEFALASLDSASLGQFLESELGGPAAPDLLEWVERIAGSNPLFFGELLRWAVEQGIASERSGEWVLVREPEAIEVPRSAESTIERRLTRLEPDVYKLLEYGSVEGNEFGSTTVAELLGMDELAFEEAMEPLVRLHRLVKLVDTRELPSGDLSSIYQFSHSLIQDVLHRNLQGKRRILLHRKMAEILEKVHAGQTEAVAHKLAIHFNEGRLPVKAFAFALQGAARASSLYAHRDAIGLIRLALSNAQDDDQKADAFERLGESSRIVGHFPEALEAYGHALALAQQRGNRTRGLTLRRKLVLVEFDHGAVSPAELEQQLDDLVAEARELTALDELCQILLLISGLSSKYAPERAERGEQALRIAQELGAATLVGKARISLAKTLVFGPDPKAGLPHLHEAFELYKNLGDRGHIGLTHNLRAIVHAMGGEYADASREFEAAATAFVDAGDPVNEASVRNNLGLVLTRTGDFEGAERNLLKSLRLTRRLNAAAGILYPIENLARLSFARGDFDDAVERWRELLEMSQRTGYRGAEVIAHCGLGEVALAQGDAETARTHEKEAQSLLVAKDAWHEGATDFNLLAARLAADSGEMEGALQLLRAAEEAHAKMDRYLFATVLLQRGELTARKDPVAAAPLLAEALEIFRQLGTTPMSQRAEAILTTHRGAH